VSSNLNRPQMWNRYTYVESNPLNYTDPSGLWQVPDVHYYPPVGDSPLTGYYYGEGISVGSGEVGTLFTDAATNLFLDRTSYDGFIGLATNNPTGSSALDRIIGGARGYYQNRLDQMAVDGNYAAAFVDWFGLEFVLPQNAKDLGVQAVLMVLLPEAKALRFTEDQQALVALAKEAKKLGGVGLEEAKILGGWAKEYGLPFRGPESHPGRLFGQLPHIHVGSINHILVNF